MQGKKTLFLFLALLLPIGIFVFLKLFGKNEFDIAPLHQDNASAPADCNITHQFPYVVPDSIMQRLVSHEPDSLYLINLSQNISARIMQEVDYPEVRIVSDREVAFMNDSNFRKCILLVPGGEDLIVVDNRGRIRGYYASADRDEVDRLFLELKILLKKY
jgi:hypothetical protein